MISVVVVLIRRVTGLHGYAPQVEEHLEAEEEVLHLHENSFLLFWLLERLLQPRGEGGGAGAQDQGAPQNQERAGTPQDQGAPQDQEPQRGSGLLGSPDSEAFLGVLGSGVLLLSDEFPLFALYMWQVGALLSGS